MEAMVRETAVYPFNSRFIEVLGRKIHYVEHGSGDPVLFIHGNPTSSYLWRNVIPGVVERTGRRAIALDLLGFGRSDKPDDVVYTLRLHADVIRGFVEALGLERSRWWRTTGAAPWGWTPSSGLPSASSERC